VGEGEEKERGEEEEVKLLKDEEEQCEGPEVG
jgi:hypothetical protein